MKLKDLKEFVSKLPSVMDDFEVINGEVGNFDDIEKENGEKLTYRVDKPILILFVDEETKQLCLLHQSQDEVDFILKNK